ncbi:cell envelope biogenesis protein TolA [Providencia rettgeri]|uniref:cell envelope biogenesis protein TolA n=1 Tax=Providencia rettgeri TaxID=587 RepID=UPI002180C158|nr:cell envelope biogenesis protein TolA [Providencia rettgeri]
MGKLVIGLIAVSIMMASSINTATARNYPCSGSKGGVDRCESGKFICNDGSTSRSEQVCTTSLKNDINSKAGIAGATIGSGVAKQSSKPSISDPVKATGDRANKTVNEKVAKKSDKASDPAKAIKEKATKADKDSAKAVKEKATKATDKDSAKAAKEKATKAADKQSAKTTKEKSN